MSGHTSSQTVHKKRLYPDRKTNTKERTPMSAAEQYITDEKGNKVAVILPLTEYQHLKEDLHDL